MKRRNTQMKLRVVLSSLLLGCLLLITARGDSSARVVPGSNKLQVTRITAMHARKETFERNGVAYMTKLWLGGKKHTTHEETRTDYSKNGRAADGGGTPKISGKEEYALQKSFGSLGEQKNDQNKLMIIGPKASKFTNFVTPRSSPTNTNRKCSQDCNAVPLKASLKRSSRPDERQISEEPQGTSQKDESQSLVEAAKEIANLIYRDYKGRPSHKPPINNHEPGN